MAEIQIASKEYVDQQNAELVKRSGDTMTGILTVPKFSLGNGNITYSLEEISFPTGKYECVIELNNSTASFGGTMKVELNSSYNTGNATGGIEKFIDIATGAEGIAYQKSYYERTNETTGLLFMISDVFIRNGKYCIKIVQNSGGNRVKTKLVCDGFGFINFRDMININNPVVSTETFVKPITKYTEQMNALVEKTVLNITGNSGYTSTSKLIKYGFGLCIIYLDVKKTDGTSFKNNDNVVSIPAGYRPLETVTTSLRSTNSNATTNNPAFSILELNGNISIRVTENDTDAKIIRGTLVYRI